MNFIRKHKNKIMAAVGSAAALAAMAALKSHWDASHAAPAAPQMIEMDDLSRHDDDDDDALLDLQAPPELHGEGVMSAGVQRTRKLLEGVKMVPKHGRRFKSHMAKIVPEAALANPAFHRNVHRILQASNRRPLKHVLIQQGQGFLSRLLPSRKRIGQAAAAAAGAALLALAVNKTPGILKMAKQNFRSIPPGGLPIVEGAIRIGKDGVPDVSIVDAPQTDWDRFVGSTDSAWGPVGDDAI